MWELGKSFNISVKENRSAVKCASIFTLIYVLLSMLQPLYSGIDNYLISLVTNSIYGKNNYVIFLHPFLCYFLRVLHLILPFADIYVLLNEILSVCGIWIISYYIYELSGSNFKRICGYLVMGILVYFKSSRCFDNFTMTAVFFVCVGMIVLFSILLDKIHHFSNIFYLTIGSFYISVGFMWRQDAGIMGVPYILFIYLCLYFFKNSKEKQILLKKSKFLLVPIIVVFSLIGTNYIWQHSEKYQGTVRYNNARSAIVDYTHTWSKELPDYISENDIKSAEQMYLFDTDYFDSNYLENLGKYELRNTIKIPSVEYVQMMLFSMTEFFPMACISCIIIFMLILFSQLDLMKKIASFMLFGSYCCYATYFIYIGRILPRVYTCIYLYMFASLLLILYQQYPNILPVNHKIKQSFKYISVSILGLSLLVELYLVMQNISSMQSALYANINNKNIVEQNINSHDLYLWDVYTFDDICMKAHMKAGKLYSEEFIQHNLPAGEWIYGTAYFKEYLQRLGVSNPVQALMTRKNTYFVGTKEQNMIVETYLKEHYDQRYKGISVSDYNQNNELKIWKYKMQE